MPYHCAVLVSLYFDLRAFLDCAFPDLHLEVVLAIFILSVLYSTAVRRILDVVALRN